MARDFAACRRSAHKYLLLLQEGGRPARPRIGTSIAPPASRMDVWRAHRRMAPAPIADRVLLTNRPSGVSPGRVHRFLRAGSRMSAPVVFSGEKIFLR